MASPFLHLAQDADEVSHIFEQENDDPQATEGNIYRRGKAALNEPQRMPKPSTHSAHWARTTL